MGKQNEIFESKFEIDKEGHFYIVKLTNEVSYSKKIFDGFTQLVSESDHLYPGIDAWFSNKVVPGVKEGKRFAFVVLHKGRPIAEAIVKRGESTKLCSMRIEEEFQKKSLGPILFSEIAKVIEKYSKNIHFTAPESLIEQYEGLFNRFGFEKLGKSNRKYRPGNDEFVFKADSRIFVRRAKIWLNEANQFNLNKKSDSIVMSIKPKYAQQIMSNKKTIELRRRFSKSSEGFTVFIYATLPVGCVIGEATVANVVEGSLEEIWINYQDKLGCTKIEYDNYCNGLKTINALVFEDVRAYSEPLPWNLFSTTFNAPKKPPQSYNYIRPHSLGLMTSINHDIVIHTGEQASFFDLK